MSPDLDTILEPNAAVSSEPLPIGAKAGPWKVERELGRGGMGAIYSVIHDTIGKRAALKVVHPIASGQLSPEVIEASLMNEGKAVNRVHHRVIVDIFDAGTLPDCRPYLVMEHIDGVSLGDHAAKGKLSPELVLHILLELCDALAAAHAVGVIHRDLKPDNVMLVETPLDPNRPCVKLLDWGIAKLTDARCTGEMFFGTPDYIAPERVRSQPSTAHSDVYSLGVMAYELFLEHKPFEGDTAERVALMHLGKAPPRPSDTWPGIPQALEDLLLAMLAKDPQQRPAITEVAKRLARIRDELHQRSVELPRQTFVPVEQPAPSRNLRALASFVLLPSLVLVAMVGTCRDDSVRTLEAVAAETTPTPAPAVVPPPASPAPLPALLFQPQVHQIAIVSMPPAGYAPAVTETAAPAPAQPRQQPRKPAIAWRPRPVAVRTPTPTPVAVATPPAPAPATVAAAAPPPATPPAPAPVATPPRSPSAELLARQYQRVGAALLALRQQRGEQAASDISARYRRIQIQHAMTTPELRVATAAELDRLAARIGQTR